MTEIEHAKLSFAIEQAGKYIYDSDGQRIYDLAHMCVVRALRMLPGKCGHDVEVAVLIPIDSKRLDDINDDVWSELKPELEQALGLVSGSVPTPAWMTRSGQLPLYAKDASCIECVPPPPGPDDGPLTFEWQDMVNPYARA